MITITESAKKELLKQSNNKKFVRLVVDAGGCNGFSYNFNFDSQDEDDILVENMLLIDEISFQILETFEIDYINDLTGSYFRLNIKKATSQCGCGTSFSI